MTLADTVVAMGHGSPGGLFAVGAFQGSRGYIVDVYMAQLLREKAGRCVMIWCNADQFVQANQVPGFYSGMFVSEVVEAYAMGLPGVTQAQVDHSNDLFAKEAGRGLGPEGDVVAAWHAVTEGAYRDLARTCPVAHYNYQRLRYLPPVGGRG